MTRDNELGEFLRARRALVPPERAGLPPEHGRRVAGLRREEVALLAGVSTDYLVRLEQGRERHPSRQVLVSVARALQLDEDATTHLLRIGFPEVLPERAPVTAVSQELRRLMDQMPASPAFVVGPGQDVLAANALARALYSPFSRFDNLLRMIFLDPAAPDFYLDWEQIAHTAVRNLRALSTEAAERTEQVVGALSVRSPAFATWWASHDVGPRTTETKRFRHPEVGELSVHFTTFAVGGSPGQHLSVYTAEPGSRTAEALARLGSRTPRHDETSGETTTWC
ncbi:helix-turn-helix transcriptional regulator [Actinomycetospora flava]|uniref:Helix-turn-helix transcriptional regulator n=1 Tax=Actinomycetospora flava TaxID=3129232 RepID=A0ABU8MAG7_9PSEU